MLNPTLPVYEGFTPAWGQANAEQLWGQAHADVIKNGMKVADAVDKAFKRAERDLREGHVRCKPGEAIMSVTQQALADRTELRRHASGAPRLASAGCKARTTSGRLPSPCRTWWCSSPSSSIRSATGCGSAASQQLYAQLFADPRYLTAVINTLIYVGVGVNLKMFLAFMLSGFFMRKRWWVKALLVVFILPWATPALPAYMSIHWLMNGQWGMLNNILYLLFGIDGPVYLNSHWMGLACEYRRLYLEEPAVLDDHPAGRTDGGPAGTL